MSNHNALTAYIQSDVWALEIGVAEKFVDVFNRHVAEVKLDGDEIQAVTRGKGGDPQLNTIRGTAVIPISGVIAKGASMVNNTSQSQGTAIETIRAQLRSAVADPDVERIMLHVASPGGSISGVADMASEIRAAAIRKPLTAFIDDVGASAAYWMASQATQVFANRNAAVGAIGVYAVVVDSSKAAEAKGLKFHVIRSGPLKGAGEVGDEVTEDQLANFQTRIDDVFGLFVDDVAEGRGMAREKVMALADGSTLTGSRAKSAKLVDAITDFDGALKRTAKLTAGDSRRRGARADGKEPIVAQEDKAAEAVAALAAKNDEDVVEAARAEARDETLKAERKRTADIMGAVGDFPDIAKAAIQDGLTVDQAKAEAFDASQAQLAVANERLAAIATSGCAPAAQAVDTDDAATAPAGDPDDGKAGTYEARISALRTDQKLTAGQAHKVASNELPKSKQAWIDASQGPKNQSTRN